MIQGRCHCGAVRFEAPMPEQMARCNCTYCDRIGALWGYTAPDDFKLLSDQAALLTYAPNGTRHYSCGTCGMVTHQLSQDFEANDGSMKAGYNLRMAQDFDRSVVRILDLDGRHQW